MKCEKYAGSGLKASIIKISRLFNNFSELSGIFETSDIYATFPNLYPNEIYYFPWKTGMGGISNSSKLKGFSSIILKIVLGIGPLVLTFPFSNK